MQETTRDIFCEWETFRNIEELNTKLKGHLEWSNNKTMRTLDYKESNAVIE